MQVPLLDLKAQYATIADEISAAILEVLESQRCIGGPKVAELEEKISDLGDCKYAVGVSSGTDADALALAVLYDFGAKRGDEVIIPALSFVSTGTGNV